jgi:hypothetical protein
MMAPTKWRASRWVRNDELWTILTMQRKTHDKHGFPGS